MSCLNASSMLCCGMNTVCLCLPVIVRLTASFLSLQEKDLNTVADNLAPKYLDISSSSGSRRRILRLDTLEETMDTMKPLARKRTLGMDMEFSLRMTMSLAFSLLMGFGLLIMIIISSQFTQAILRNYES